MLKFINDILVEFKSCFKKHNHSKKVFEQRTFKWFVVVIMGFLLRTDLLGVSSFLRVFPLNPVSYHYVINFFNSNVWKVSVIVDCWIGIVASRAPLYTNYDYNYLVGDHTKVPKEGFFMACLGRHHQESETVSKGEKIHGHCWENIGVLIGNPAEKLFSLPLISRIACGVESLRSFPGNEAPLYSMAVQVYYDAWQVAKKLYDVTQRASILICDRFFLCVQGLKLINQLNKEAGHVVLEVVTKVKRGFKAYTEAPPREPGQKGAPRKKGDTVDLFKLFEDPSMEWTEGTCILYGVSSSLEYCYLDLLWGRTLYQKLRFVLVRNWNGCAPQILVSTSLTLTAEQIINIYARRQNIENFFREFKQNFGGFFYHFWTKVLDKYNHFAKTGDPSPMDNVKDPAAMKKVVLQVKRMEGYVTLAGIAMGITQLIALVPEYARDIARFRYIRRPEHLSSSAPPTKVPSEASVLYYLQHRFYAFCQQNPDLEVTHAINSVLKKHGSEAA